ncbi:hypothetical protein [Paramicrobacterium fandaimingii]|uniref:hypothetical protein n=1 Tax=Paramicrobacterium fandaimingii TaxID=2708079 RepID=UPI001423831E|nr:hypothetical protein [Microbacterium fandaimingii]
MAEDRTEPVKRTDEVDNPERTKTPPNASNAERFDPESMAKAITEIQGETIKALRDE